MSFNIDKPQQRISDTIQYLVTRPIEPIVDDGKGNYNISPIGFPLRNVSETLGVIPTRVTPTFDVGYSNIASGINVKYTSTKPINELFGEITLSENVKSIVNVSGIATVTTYDPHGYTNLSSVTISGANQIGYNKTATVTVTGLYTFTYSVDVATASPASGAMTTSIQLNVNDDVKLTGQDDVLDNGYYVVQETTWRRLHSLTQNELNICANIYNNIYISSDLAPLVIASIDTITSESINSNSKVAVVITSLPHGFCTGKQILIDGSAYSVYNGLHTIEVINKISFRYEIDTITAVDVSGSCTASYQTVTGDLVELCGQGDNTQNGIYYVNSGSTWKYFGAFYKYNGTENDNVAGNYGISSDNDGNVLTHYRNGYSLTETSNFLRDKLEYQVELGKFKGSNKNLNEHGAFVQWLLSGRKVNVGGVGSDKNVVIDGFGLGDPNSVIRSERSTGDINPSDKTTADKLRTNVSRYRKQALWGLTNHHSRSLEGFYNKSAYVKDYPFIYNSEYNETEVEPQFNGGHLDVSIDAERWRISVNGTNVTTNTNLRPITMDMLWYHRDNAYHNNITLDVSKDNVYGRHSLSLINNLDRPDFVSIDNQEIYPTDIITGTPGTITTPDGTHWMSGDYIKFEFPEGSIAPAGLSSSVVYMVASGYPIGDSIRLVTTSNAPVAITSVGVGMFKMNRIVSAMYNNVEVVNALDDLSSITLHSGLKICKKETVSNITKYYTKTRKKGSLLSLAPKGSWTEETLSYDSSASTTTPTTLLDAIYVNGIYVAVGMSGLIARSTDGIIWSYTTVNSENLNAICYNGTTYYVAGSGGVLLKSTDAITWTSVNISVSYTINSLAYGNSTLVAVCHSGFIYSSTDDGATWTLRVTGQGNNLYKVLYANSKFVAIGINGNTQSSNDGISWVSTWLGVYTYLNDLIYDGIKFVTVGSFGDVYTSVNGTTWITTITGLSPSGNTIGYGGGQYVMYGLNSTLYTSTDAINWVSQSDSSSDSVRKVLYANGSFITFGDVGITSNNDNILKVYLNSAETDFVVFTHPSKTNDELLTILNDNNDMIPVPFNINTNNKYLTELFVNNSLVDYTNPLNNSEKIRSKKTFIHLPAPLDLKDGTPFELDVSLPIMPFTDSFNYNTLGSISGYKNYVTQPRVYVFGGYQNIECSEMAVSSAINTNGVVTLTTTTNHGIYTGTVDIDVNNNILRSSNIEEMAVNDIVRFTTYGTLPAPLNAFTDYVITNIVDEGVSLSTTTGTEIIFTNVGSGVTLVVLKKGLRVSLNGAVQTEYNKEFEATVLSNNKITFNVPSSYSTTITGNVFITQLVTSIGNNGVNGLTERNNSHIFGAMPEVEHATSDNIYHQSFTPSDIVGSPYQDKRVLLATVYPTSTNTFQWRMDNDPQLRLLQWSMLNICASGGNTSTGSFANVAYKRNVNIFDEFPLLFKNGENGRFSVYENPLTYTSELTPAFNQQQINALVRIKYPSTIGSTLSNDDNATVGSFEYQASTAYTDLIRDFGAGRVRVKTIKETTEPVHQLMEYGNSLPTNHNLVTDIPNSFYDMGASSKVLDFTSLDFIDSSITSLKAENRWITKDIYLPSSIVNATDNTDRVDVDAFYNVNPSLKAQISTYFPVNERESNAGNRYMVGNLNSYIDPSYEFSVGTDHKFVNFLKASDTSTVNLDDVRRRLWDSCYEIDANERQIQNAYLIKGIGVDDETSVKFNGLYWIPFAKIFSTDNLSPSENNITDIRDYSAITGGSNDSMNTTLTNALQSNPIASRFKKYGYTDAFASVNTTDSTTAIEEFIRNYVAGYSNKLPFRFYNGYKIGVYGNEDSNTHANNITNPLVNTESEVDRIYKYTVKNFLTEYVDVPSIDVATYFNDNFVLLNKTTDDDIVIIGSTESTSMYDLISNGIITDPSGNSKLLLCNWVNLDGWTRQTGTFWIPAGTGYVSNGNLYSSSQNPFYRYDTPIPDNFVVESFIVPQDDQSLYFCSHRADPTQVNWYTSVELSYFGIIFENYPPNGVPNQIIAMRRKDNEPIEYDYDLTQSEERLFRHTHEYEYTPIATYIQGRMYRVLFARLSSNEFMLKVYDTTNNTLVCEYTTNLVIPNVLGYDNDSIDLLLCPGRHGGYYNKQSFAIGLDDTQVRQLFGYTSNYVYAQDPNPAWWYFEQGNPSTNAVNSKIKDLITVSGMNYIAERDFYVNKMQFNYTHVKMSFVFSKKAGRWLTIDYRQAPTSYLTPTFGATALKQKEKSIVYPSKTGKSSSDYVSIDRKINYFVDVIVSNTTSNIKVTSIDSFKVGNTVAFTDYNIGIQFKVLTVNVDTSEITISNITDNVELVLPLDVSTYIINYAIAKESTINTILTGQYPMDFTSVFDGSNGLEVTDLLWKNPLCTETNEAQLQLETVPYWQMPSMELNKFAYPFLSAELPYDEYGNLKEILNPMVDNANTDSYRFTKLLEPNKSINFVVPNNVHGGSIDPDNDLFLYQPHMWSVYWHMRPAVSAMDGCDIPSPVARTGGTMADPVLNNIFTYPNPRDPQFYIPWHEDMSEDWLNAGWLIIDARIRNNTVNPTRDKYFEFYAL